MTTSLFSNTGQWDQAHSKQTSENGGMSTETTLPTPSQAEEVVLPETLKWARSISSELRPRALVIKFPRIANALADAWKQPALFNTLLCQLMLDDRGGRQGFPFDVLQDLANLRVHFDNHYKNPDTDIWRSVTDKYKNQEPSIK